MSELTERFASVQTHRMRYLMAGSGPPLVLVHGIVEYSFSWRFNIGPLAGSFTVYAPDLLNLGFSHRISGLPADLSSTSGHLLEFMDRLDLGSARLVGSSHGGGVAIVTAARAPDRVERLVLAAPVNPWSRRTDRVIRFYRSRIGRLFAAAAPFCPAPLQRYGYARVYGDPRRLRPGTVEGYAKTWRIAGTIAHAMAIIDGWNEDMRLIEESLGGITAPVLLLWGDRDPVIDPASALILRKKLRNAQLATMPGVGHLPFEESPEEFNRIVGSFLV